MTDVRRKQLFKIFSDLNILHHDLHQLVVEYESLTQYDAKPFQIIKVSKPCGMAVNENFLYICCYEGFKVFDLEIKN